MIRVSKNDQIAALRQMCNALEEERDSAYSKGFAAGSGDEGAYQRRIAELEERVASLQQFHDWALPIQINEWICKSCGIRQENPEKPEPTF
jgi:rubrerythrin